MSRSRFCVLLALAAVLAAAADTAYAQKRTTRRGLHVGYVYPAGGAQGSTFEAIVGGQYLDGVDKVHVSGGGVEAKIVELIRPINGRELNELRIETDQLMAKKAVVRNDFETLLKFRSFKNAKSVKDEKPDEAKQDKEVQELKQKYAGATWTAADENRLAEIRQKMRASVRRPANPAIGELAVVQFTVAADAAPGERDLRIGTSASLSNPLTFCISPLPEFAGELSKRITEQKSSIAKTSVAPRGGNEEGEIEIKLPAVVNGQILPGQVDRYRFEAAKGQRLVVSASARELIPYIADAVPGWFQATLTVYDAEGKELAYDDDFRFNPDPVLFCRIPADGQYVLEIKDAIYRGREDFVYRITVGELPFVTGIFPLGGPAGEKTAVELQGWNLPVTRVVEDARKLAPGIHLLAFDAGQGPINQVPFAVGTLPECLENQPNDRPDQAQQVELPVIVNGRIEQPDDEDVFRFEGRAGTEIVAEVVARRLNSPVDSILKLSDAAGKEVAANDDHEDKGAGLLTHQADSLLRATLPADGTYYLHIADMQHKGGPEYGYRLRISAPRPDFELRIVPSTLNMRAGASEAVTVYALRKDGYTGPISLSVAGGPQGFELSDEGIPAEQEQVRLTLTAPYSAPSGPVSLKLEGSAEIDGRKVVHDVVPAEDMMQAFAYRHLVPVNELAVNITGRANSAPRDKVKILGDKLTQIPVGGTARVRLSVPRTTPLYKIKLELTDPPKGISIKNVSRTGEGIAIVLQCDADEVKPGQKGSLTIGAFGKNQSGGKPFATLPAIPFEIVKK